MRVDGATAADDDAGRDGRGLATADVAVPAGRRWPAAGHGGQRLFQEDPHWRDCLLFYEYFHGDTGQGLGASHQTGWTGLVATLIDEWRR